MGRRTPTARSDRSPSAADYDVQRRLVGLLTAISGALAEGGGLPRVLQACCQALVDHIGAAFARVWLLEPGTDFLRLEASAGLYTHLDGGHARMRVGELEIGRVAASRRPYLTNDVQRSRRISDPEWARREGMVALACHPMLVEGRLVGVVAVFARQALPDEVLVNLASVSAALAQYAERERSTAAVRESEEKYRGVFETALDGLLIVEPDMGTIVEANPAAAAIFGYRRAELVGGRLEEHVHSEARPQIAAALLSARERVESQLEIPCLRRRREVLDCAVRTSGVAVQGRPHALVVVRDATQEVRAQRLIEQRVAERTRELATLLAVAEEASTRSDLGALLDVLLGRLGEIVDFTAAAFLLIKGGGELAVAAYRGSRPPPEVTGRTVRPPPGSVFEEILASALPRNGAGAAPPGLLKLHLLGRGEHTGSWLIAPAVSGGRPLGLLVLVHTHHDVYDRRSVGLAAAVADHAGIAIENEELIREVREKSALEERQRLARDFHDAISQSISSISMSARVALQAVSAPGGEERAKEALGHVVDASEAALSELRALIFELWPESLERGLAPAIRSLGDAAAAGAGFQIEYDLPREPPIGLADKESLFRICQEALNNAGRHARAKSVRVGLRQAPDRAWELRVEDDGRGFVEGLQSPGRVGLASMRRRAEARGWSLDVDSRPGRGTAVTVRTRPPPDRAGP